MNLSPYDNDQYADISVLSLPAIAEIDEDVPISKAKVYHRRAREALSPEQEPLAVLETLKLQLGSDAFSAQYQQAPAPPGGEMIRRHWIQRYSELPAKQDSAHPHPKLGYGEQGRSRE
jgi:hypothetical protein